MGIAYNAKINFSGKVNGYFYPEIKLLTVSPRAIATSTMIMRRARFCLELMSVILAKAAIQNVESLPDIPLQVE